MAIHRAILGFKENENLKYNHGDGRGLTRQSFNPNVFETPVDTKRTALYRYFDTVGVLLYIGISSSAMARMCQHKHAKYSWTDEIQTMTIEWFSGRSSALQAEKEAIIEEKPIHNIIHNNSE